MPLKMMVVISPYLACTQTNARLSIARAVGGGEDQSDRADEFEYSEGHPDFPRGNAPKDGACSLTLSNMKP